MSFNIHSGSAHLPPDGVWRHVPYSDAEWKEPAYLDEHDRDDVDDSPRLALSRLLRSLIDELPVEQRDTLYAYFFDSRGLLGDVHQGKDSGLRATARLLGRNPRTGRPIDKKTVKKYIETALAALRERIIQLPDWQRELVARSLTPGALPDGDVLELDGLPGDFPEGLSE